ncbi:C4-dicarboxylate ABC transporter permease, partial [Mycobacterium tuberculosis]|nr:C4-dicarboxylate ABC transporter permease [Mycobacterium tuberculosis]
MIGFAGTLVTTSQVYLALLVAGSYQVLLRIGLTAWFVHRDGIRPETGADHVPLRTSLRLGWTSVLVFLGAIIPILIT